MTDADQPQGPAGGDGAPGPAGEQHSAEPGGATSWSPEPYHPPGFDPAAAQGGENAPYADEPTPPFGTASPAPYGGQPTAPYGPGPAGTQYPGQDQGAGFAGPYPGGPGASDAGPAGGFAAPYPGGPPGPHQGGPYPGGPGAGDAGPGGGFAAPYPGGPYGPGPQPQQPGGPGYPGGNPGAGMAAPGYGAGPGGPGAPTAPYGPPPGGAGGAGAYGGGAPAGPYGGAAPGGPGAPTAPYGAGPAGAGYPASAYPRTDQNAPYPGQGPGYGAPPPWPGAAGTAGPQLGLGPYPGAPYGGAPPYPGVVAPPPDRRHRKRAFLFGGVGLVVAAALVAGLLVWAPWTPPPVLRPAGLKAGTVSTTSASFSWAAPKTGPQPDRYLILHDGKTIGSVPGSVRTYRVSNLIPGSSYDYRVVAERGGKRSPESAEVTVTTPVPPTTDARFGEVSLVNIKVRSGAGHLTGSVRSGWTETWVTTPTCSSGACSVKLSARFNDHTFSTTLTRSGGVYTGHVKAVVFDCGPKGSSFPVTSTVTIRATVHTAQMSGPVWTVSTWSGSMQVSSPYVAKGDYYCTAFKLSTSLNGASS